MDGMKPKLGVVFFAARWFEEVVLGSNSSAKAFSRFINEDTSKIKEALSEACMVVDCPIVTSMEKARESVRRLFSEDVDAVLLCFVVWSEDEYLLPFRDIMKVKPAIMWAYIPYKRAPSKSDIMTLFRNSGIVSSFEGFGVMEKLGIKPAYVVGSSQDRETFNKIISFSRAARVYKELKMAKLGILPYRNDQMIVTYVDEFRLYTQIGPKVDYLSVLQLKKTSEGISGDEVTSYVKKIRSEFKIDKRVTEKQLYESARASLGMEKLINDHNLDGLALGDLNPELHEVMGLRPCLYPESLARSEKVVGIEGDLGGTTGMLILQRLASNPVMFTEMFNYDPVENTVVAGHAGPSNYLLADEKSGISITPDYELMDSVTGTLGVWMEFIGKPGRVTVLNFMCTNDNFQMTVLGGESLGGQKRVDGYPHFYIRIDPPVNEFINTIAEHGVTHHWAVVHGDFREELKALSGMLGVRLVQF
jgi:L-arabinose isomerase